MKFLNKRKKLIHHNEEEPLCNEEKMSLIKLYDQFKECISHVIKENDINVEEVKELEEVVSLKATFEDMVKNLIDKELFVDNLGKMFEI